MSLVPGDGSRLKLEEESPLLAAGGRGDALAVAGSEKTSDGVSRSGVKARSWGSCGGNAGNDLSTLGATAAGGFFDFLRRRAMSDSWQDMQKIPCDVRA
jgi:hypothetical protein